jgi:hypothetical protein
MKLRFPRIPSDDPRVDYEIARARLRERRKIITELREKYAEELRTAAWWKRCLIALRIHRELARIYRNRLYAVRLSPVP